VIEVLASFHSKGVKWGSNFRPDNLCWVDTDKRIKAVCLESCAFSEPSNRGRVNFFASTFSPSAYTAPEVATALQRARNGEVSVGAMERRKITEPSIAGDYWALGMILLEIERGLPLFTHSRSRHRITSDMLVDLIADPIRLARFVTEAVASVSSVTLREVLLCLLDFSPEARTLRSPSPRLMLAPEFMNALACGSPLPRLQDSKDYGKALVSALINQQASDASLTLLTARMPFEPAWPSLPPTVQANPGVSATPRPLDNLPELALEPIETKRQHTASSVNSFPEHRFFGRISRFGPGAAATASVLPMQLQPPIIQKGQIVNCEPNQELESALAAPTLVDELDAVVERPRFTESVPVTRDQQSSLATKRILALTWSYISALLIFLKSYFYYNDRSTYALVPRSSCGSCSKCTPVFFLDAQALSDSKKVMAVASPSWADGVTFVQTITTEGFFSVNEISQKEKIRLTTETSGAIIQTDGIVLPFNGLVYNLDRLLAQPELYKLKPSSDGSEVWELPSSEIVLASNDSFLGLHSFTSPLRYGGASFEYASIANTHTVQILLPGPAPAYEDRFRLNCTVSGFFVNGYDDLPVSAYAFPGIAPSVTRVTATIKWMDNSLVASCVANIRDGPELPFFTATVGVVSSPAYECITHASSMVAFFSAFNNAAAYVGVMLPIMKYAVKYSKWLRKNCRELSLLFESKPVKIFIFFSIPRNVLVFFFFFSLMLALFFVGLFLIKMDTSGNFEEDVITSSCSCAFGFCGAMPGSACELCIDGYELVEESCKPISCICDNGVCARGSSTICAACAEAFYLTDGKCMLSSCDCPNGACSATTSYCTSCNSTFSLRSTGLLALDSERGGYFFTTPVCIPDSLFDVSSLGGGLSIYLKNLY
jgi:hypothetical protein